MTHPERYPITVSDLHYIKDNTPVGDYFTIDQEGAGVWLHDVVTKQPLSDASMPPGVLQQPDLRAGLNFLQQAGADKRITVQMVLGGHGGVDDFTSMQRQHGDVLQDASIIALEMSSLKQDNQGPVLPWGVVPVLSTAPGRSDFQQAQLAWAQREQKIILPSELISDDDTQLVKSLGYLWDKVYLPMTLNKAYSPAIRHTAALIAERSYQRTRQPAILARMGQLLQRLDQQGQLPKEHTNIPLILGSWHAKSANRFDALNIPVETYPTTHKVYDNGSWATFGQAIMEATYTSYASLDTLSLVPPYIKN